MPGIARFHKPEARVAPTRIAPLLFRLPEKGRNLSPGAAGTWQLGFRDLRWSMPGDLEVQFAVKGVGRADRWGAVCVAEPGDSGR
jgi:hypothetical protein